MAAIGDAITTKAGSSERPNQEKLKNYTDGLNQNNELYLVLGTLEGAIERCGARTFAP